MEKRKKKTFVNTSNIHTTYKFLGEEPCNKMEPEINRLLLLLLLLLLLFIIIIIIYFSTVCNFQSMKSLLELNSLSSKFFCYITWCIISPIRRDTGRLSNETSRQILLFLRNSGLKITN